MEPSLDGLEIALSLQKVLIEQGKTIAFAESCTGGYLSHLMTSNAGSSACFLGSFITYSNVLKQKVLHVKESTLKQYGAVSQQTVEEMLEGVFQITEADFAIAVSGVAGPEGGTEKAPVGTVWFSIGERGKSKDSGCLQISGDRKEVINKASCCLLFLLHKKL